LKRSGRGWKENILHSFGTYGGDAGYPSGDLALDGKGNVYGMGAGGKYNNGAVFELSPSKNRWTEKVIHSFNGQDGGEPLNDGLIFDAVGNLYGTTFSGGANNGGVVFKLVHAHGQWSEKLLYTFSGLDGCNPEAGVVLDQVGNIYGTTSCGGSATLGVVFEITQ
jgi:uncharacterized repeat protein (TIGR03803 family)